MPRYVVWTIAVNPQRPIVFSRRRRSTFCDRRPAVVAAHSRRARDLARRFNFGPVHCSMPQVAGLQGSQTGSVVVVVLGLVVVVAGGRVVVDVVLEVLVEVDVVVLRVEVVVGGSVVVLLVDVVVGGGRGTPVQPPAPSQ